MFEHVSCKPTYFQKTKCELNPQTKKTVFSFYDEDTVFLYTLNDKYMSC